MDNISQYLLSVISAAALCAFAVQLVKNNSTTQKVIKLIAGVFMTLVVISPLKNIQLGDFSILRENILEEARMASASGEENAVQTMSAIIKERSEAYILDKAKNLNVDISAEITVEGTSPPCPKSVVIRGSVSPYAKGKLKRILEDDLGLGEEVQTWI